VVHLDGVREGRELVMHHAARRTVFGVEFDQSGLVSVQSSGALGNLTVHDKTLKLGVASSEIVLIF